MKASSLDSTNITTGEKVNNVYGLFLYKTALCRLYEPSCTENKRFTTDLERSTIVPEPFAAIITIYE